MNIRKLLPIRILVPGVIFILVLAAITAGAQRVPPTAREAATMPQFAQQLARPATPLHRPAAPVRGGSCSASRRSHEAQRTTPQDILYDNGPYNGTTDAWAINFGFAVSDSFTVPSNATIEGLSFVYWDASTSDLLTSVDMAVGSTSFGGTFQTLSGVTNTLLGINQYGYALYKADYTFTDISWNGDGYITLQNACSTSGCSVSNPIYWDENSGPSRAYENTLGSIPSETFSLTGHSGILWQSPCMPERSGGFNVIYDFTGHEGGEGPHGVVIDALGDLYGVTRNWSGTVYKLMKAGSDWALNTLYSFPSGSQNYPGEVMIGPHGILYGAAYGGVPNCYLDDGGQYYCGFIFGVRPSPTACRTSSCSWVENVLDEFTGSTDPWRGNSLVSDRAGNLYGVSQYGGVWQKGAVFELTPAGTTWIENILYNFTGGSDGGSPTTLLVGNDGDLYGMGGTGGANASGVVFRLSRSGSGWTESVIYDLPDTTWSSNPHSLIQDSAGNLFGEYEYYYTAGGQILGVVFVLTPTGGNWVYTELRHGDDQQPANDYFDTLTLDTAGNLWGTGGGSYGCSDPISHGYIFRLALESDSWQYSTPVYWDDTTFVAEGALAMDTQNNLYGTTYGCGRHEKGTVWEFTPTQ
jgi:hypothetical protein